MMSLNGCFLAKNAPVKAWLAGKLPNATYDWESLLGQIRLPLLQLAPAFLVSRWLHHAWDFQMDLADYRNRPSEQARISDLISMLPGEGETALDIGARDGYISILLTDKFSNVTALDLEQPVIEHPRVTCAKGDITALDFPVGSFDLVFCAEVLEHIPPSLLAKACQELARVTRSHLLIGVPYRQDTRVGRTTCRACGKSNPPWGHVNSFDDERLAQLFPGLRIVKKSFVGLSGDQTNELSCALLDFAGNPFGTYQQDESCVHCASSIGTPGDRTVWQKVATKLAYSICRLQKPFVRPHPQWIHLLLGKPAI